MSHNSQLRTYIWASIRRMWGPIATAVGAGITYLAWVVKPDTKVSASVAVVAAVVAVVVILILFDALTEALRRTGKHLPTVRLALKPPASYRDIAAILLLEPSDLFSVDSVVSVHQVQDGDYEALIGIGRVMGVQENQMIQIGLQKLLIADSAALVERLFQKDVSLLRTILVKPNVSNFIMRSQIEEIE